MLNHGDILNNSFVNIQEYEDGEILVLQQFEDDKLTDEIVMSRNAALILLDELRKMYE